jgi:hypothetical protein
MKTFMLIGNAGVLAQVFQPWIVMSGLAVNGDDPGIGMLLLSLILRFLFS